MMRVPSSRGEWAINTTFFSVLEPLVLERDAGPSKHLFGVLESQAVLGEILLVLRLIPFVPQPQL
jgi:hypothetical protein